MTFKRLWYSLCLCLIPGNDRRAAYIRKKKVYATFGENCSIMKRKIPLYSNLIRFGNNVHVASNVSFLTHDISHRVLNQMKETNGSKNEEYLEKVGCIEIGDNVFIGSGSKILYDIKIGSNVIIGTGSIVTHDVPDNSVVAGVPARVIGTFENYLKKTAGFRYPKKMKPRRQEVSSELAKFLWDEFDRKHVQ